MTSVFHLLRHGSHGHIGHVLTGRADGAPLTEAGRGEAEAAAKLVAGLGIDALYSSPRQRTRETADVVARHAGVKVTIAPELDEIDFGHWAGQAFERLDSDPDWRRWNIHRDTAATPAGETMQAVADRVVSLMHRLDEEGGGVFALVSHADVIKAAACRCLGLPFSSVHRFEIAPASLTTISLREEGLRLIALNVLPRCTSQAVQVEVAA